MPDLLTELKSIDIRTIVEDLGFKIVQNRRILCPFHPDDSPSLVFYPFPQNEFHCFGCGKHGDGINFYAEVHQLDLKTAVKQLAQTYLNQGQPLPKPIQHSFRKTTGLKLASSKSQDIMEALRQFCLDSPTTDSAIRAFNYLKDRGFSYEIIKQFKLFVVKDYRATNQFLKNHFDQGDLIESGLVNDRGNFIFYRHPILIPYYVHGKIAYLQGRAIGNPPEGTSKYQFLKGIRRPLFNQDILNHLKLNTRVLITEGAFDCMSAVQFGEVAVSAGSAMHYDPSWAKLFQRVKVSIYFDRDGSGQKGGGQLEEKLRNDGIIAERRELPAPHHDVHDYYQALLKGIS